MHHSTNVRVVQGARCLAVVATLVLLCGMQQQRGPSESADSSSSSAVSNAELLGAEAPATGEPVKIGFITDGEANGSAAQNEEPVAKATVQWLNEHMNGLAGHPISLDICVDQLDPGRAMDCANQMVRDNVAAVVIGSSGVIESSWNLLHDAHIPVINNAVTISTLLEDPASTFIVNDPLAQVVNVPIAVAQDEGVSKVSIVVVDLPIATDIYGGSTPDLFEHNGLELEVVPVPLGTPDITPQAQHIAQDNPDGLVSIVGPDAFCIAALQGLQAVDFQGSKFMIQQCLTASTREALSGGELAGIKTVSLAPIGDDSDASMRQYQAVLDTYATTKVDSHGHRRSHGLPEPRRAQRGDAGFDRCSDARDGDRGAEGDGQRGATWLGWAAFPVQRPSVDRPARSVFGRCVRRHARR